MPPLRQCYGELNESSLASFNSLVEDDKNNIIDQHQQRAIVSQKKNLRFDLFDSVFEIPHIDELSDKEVEETWYSKEELRVIRKACLLTVQLMEQEEEDHEDDSINDDDMELEQNTIIECFRGLEQHTNKELAIRRKEQVTSYQAVMAIQRLSDIKGIPLNDIMADFYAISCFKSRQEARLVALKDETEVRSFAICMSF